MPKTITPMTTEAEYKIAAENGAALLDKVLMAAVNLPVRAINLVVENWDLGDACYAREDYVGAWMAYGTGYLAVVDHQEFSLLKRDKHGKLI